MCMPAIAWASALTGFLQGFVDPKWTHVCLGLPFHIGMRAWICFSLKDTCIHGIHTHTHTHTHTHCHTAHNTHTHTLSLTNIHTHIHAHILTYPHTRARAHTHTHTHTHARTHARTHTHTHTHSHTHTHTHTHVHMQPQTFSIWNVGVVMLTCFAMFVLMLSSASLRSQFSVFGPPTGPAQNRKSLILSPLSLKNYKSTLNKDSTNTSQYSRLFVSCVCICCVWDLRCPIGANTCMGLCGLYRGYMWVIYGY
jgi:hypothetical protein